MPQLFDFSDVFAEWESEFQWIPKAEGHYDFANGGQWVPANGQPVNIRGIVVPLSDRDLQFEPGGVFTRDDRKVYLRKPWNMAVDDRITVKGLNYRVMREREYEEYANFNIYIAQRVDTKGRDPAV